MQNLTTNTFLLSISIFFVITLISCRESAIPNEQTCLSDDTLDPLPFPDSLYADFCSQVNVQIEARLSSHTTFNKKKFNKTIRILACMNVYDDSTKNDGFVVLSWLHLTDSSSNQCWALVLVECRCDSGGCEKWTHPKAPMADIIQDSIRQRIIRSGNAMQADSVMILVHNEGTSNTLITHLNDSLLTTKDILDFADDDFRHTSPLEGIITPMIDIHSEGSSHLTAITTIRERTWKAATGEDPNHSIPVARFLRELELMNKLHGYYTKD